VDSRHLPPKAGEVLLCLARAPGQLVTREALLNEVWGSDHTSQEALGHAISELRHALDDHLDDPKFIQTLPKRGYRFVVASAIAADHSPTLVLGADIGLFENLQRRGVLETTLAYVFVGWLLIQIADIVFPQLYLLAWAATFVTILVIAGFPIAIILAFAAGLWIFAVKESSGAHPGVFGVEFITMFNYIGTLFLNALRMIIVPLITSSIIVGVAGIGAGGNLGSLGGKTLLFYATSTLAAILIGMLVINVIQPGIVDGKPARELLALKAPDADIAATVGDKGVGDVAEIFVRMITTNVIKAAADGHAVCDAAEVHRKDRRLGGAAGEERPQPLGRRQAG